MAAWPLALAAPAPVAGRMQVHLDALAVCSPVSRTAHTGPPLLSHLGAHRLRIPCQFCPNVPALVASPSGGGGAEMAVKKNTLLTVDSSKTN